MKQNDDDVQGHEGQDYDSLKSVYQISIDTRNFEINQLIQRNNFFMLFQGVLLAAALQNQASKPFVEFIVCFSGVLVSLYQLQMASGAKYWQEWWESRVEYYEEKLREHKKNGSDEFFELFSTKHDEVFKAVSGRVNGSKKYFLTNFLLLNSFSVGRAPIKVSLVLFFTWIVLLIHTMSFDFLNYMPSIIVGFDFKNANHN